MFANCGAGPHCAHVLNHVQAQQAEHMRKVDRLLELQEAIRDREQREREESERKANQHRAEFRAHVRDNYKPKHTEVYDAKNWVFTGSLTTASRLLTAFMLIRGRRKGA